MRTRRRTARWVLLFCTSHPAPGGGGNNNGGDDEREITEALNTLDSCEDLECTKHIKNTVFEGFSGWEIAVLRNLAGAGDEGYHAAQYLYAQNVDFDNPVVAGSGTGAGWHLDRTISLNRSTLPSPNDPYTLSLIAHEAMHLEQGVFKAYTIAGEIEAWQVGFTVYYTLTGQYPSGASPLAASNIMSLDAHNMSSTDLQNARVWMKDFDRDYRSQWLWPWSLEFFLDTYDLPNPAEVCWDFCFP